ncbi:MAG: phosphopantetheine adenylyltransferase [Vicinamibacteria bacterium]|jgi:hypothetical protein|nr:phosphopantetheine adenylyltransferase [Vicinamibacteria bacterium]MBP9946539.1 phosphopantetheine adenylyltransferase [Vicinamibacteria bacterium]
MLVPPPVVVTAALLVAAVIHLLPLVGVLGAARLEALYGLPVTDPNLAILMRHRAVLFGLLGVFLAVAAFRRALQGAAFVAGFVSVVSFLGLAWSTGGYNDLVGRVVTADIVALVSLMVGVVAFRWSRS